MVKTSWKLFSDAARGFQEDFGLRMSAALAFYSAFSLAPLLLIAVAIAGAVFGTEAVHGLLDDELRRGMGPSGAFVVQDMVAHARKPADNILMSVSGVVLLLIGASGVFGELQDALNSIWKVKTEAGHGFSGFLKDRFLSFAMVLGTGFLLLVSMILSTMLQAVSSQLDKIASLPASWWGVVSATMSLVVITLLFASIFKVLPKTRVQWREVWVGAIFTAGLFAVGKYAIGWYLARQATESSYGSAASLALVLLWLYYSSAILIFGAEFTRAYSRLRGGGSKLRGDQCDQ